MPFLLIQKSWVYSLICTMLFFLLDGKSNLTKPTKQNEFKLASRYMYTHIFLVDLSVIFLYYWVNPYLPLARKPFPKKEETSFYSITVIISSCKRGAAAALTSTIQKGSLLFPLLHDILWTFSERNKFFLLPMKNSCWKSKKCFILVLIWKYGNIGSGSCALKSMQ